jgi:hypothetical protein
MNPSSHTTIYGGGATSTVLHPLVAAAMLITAALILLLPRRYVVVPFLLNVFLVPLGQVVVLGGIHFTVYRIITLFGCARLIREKFSSQGRLLAGGFNSIDRAFVSYTFLSALAIVLVWQEQQALINQLGRFIDALGGYFVLRILIRDKEDVRRAIKAFALIATVMALCMMNEQITQRNIYGYLGGSPILPSMREGRVRSQGAFSVYVSAGAFGGTILPFFLWLWTAGKSKAAAVLGMISATVITITSDTSTAISAYAAGIFALCFWPLRRQMRAVRWALVITLVGLHLVMKAPVWALIARIDLTGSSASWFRYFMVDTTIRHFSSWWLMGTKDFATWGWDMWDLSDQYVSTALTGGLAALVFFIATISRSFGRLGTARKSVEGDRKQELLLWFLCAALFANVMAYFGISYFDQIQVAWYALLAFISAATAEVERAHLPQTQEALAPTHLIDTPTNWGTVEANR